MNRYVAILSKDADSAFGLHFPDLPGCTAAGDTEEEAIANAAIALRLWMEDVADVPPPSSLEELRTRKDVRSDLAEGAMVVLVAVIGASRKQRLNVMLDPGIIEATDEAARAAGVSRSHYIEKVLEDNLAATAGAVRVSGKPSKAHARTRQG